MAAAFCERSQQIEGMGAEMDGCGHREQPAFVGLQLEATKPVTHRCHRAATPWRRESEVYYARKLQKIFSQAQGFSGREERTFTNAMFRQPMEPIS